MDNTAEQFWKNFEMETGEKLDVASMGQLFEPGDTRGEWGLIFLTDMALRYRHMPSQNSILSLFSMRPTPSSTSKEVDLVFPYASIISIETPQRTWKDKLFGSPFQRFTVTVTTAGGTERKLTLSSDPSHKLAEKLRGHCGKS